MRTHVLALLLLTVAGCGAATVGPDQPDPPKRVNEGPDRFSARLAEVDGRKVLQLRDSFGRVRAQVGTPDAARLRALEPDLIVFDKYVFVLGHVDASLSFGHLINTVTGDALSHRGTGPLFAVNLRTGDVAHALDPSHTVPRSQLPGMTTTLFLNGRRLRAYPAKSVRRLAWGLAGSLIVVLDDDKVEEIDVTKPEYRR